MKHLILCPEYPPAPSGGIGTYVAHWARLLAEQGETVHVIGRRWAGAGRPREELYGGRLIVHRVADEDWHWWRRGRLHPDVARRETRGLFHSSYPPQAFAWEAGLVAEELAETEGIDIIEAQEYQAPLYYFLLRRALGLGPSRRPPCLVHLHSPTEFIARHNDWNLSDPYLRVARQLEAYSITAADALLCPSHRLATQAERRYQLAEGSVQVIPLPLGDADPPEREMRVWEEGLVLYSGRLETRKGVFEWLDAALRIAPDAPEARFAFVGADTLDRDGRSVQEQLLRRLPRELAHRFGFYGPLDRVRLAALLSRARLAVVPSRWENFPYACIEAMASGLPVITSPEGGMAEMVQHGESGWIANGAGADALAQVLVQALGTSPARLREMGRNAERRIRVVCDNQAVLERRLDLARRLVEGARRTAGSPGRISTTIGSGPRPDQLTFAARGLVMLVDVARLTPGTFTSILEQKKVPAALALLTRRPDNRLAAWVQRAETAGLPVREVQTEAVARTGGLIKCLHAFGLDPLGLAFLRGDERLAPDFVLACESALAACPEVGVVSFWTRPHGRAQRLTAEPAPAFPYQWVTDQAAPCSVIRASALDAAYDVSADLPALAWRRVNAVLAAGWTGTTLPHLLAETDTDSLPAEETRALMLDQATRYPALVSRDRVEIVQLQEPPRSPYSRRPAGLTRYVMLWRRVRQYIQARGRERRPQAPSRAESHPAA